MKPVAEAELHTYIDGALSEGARAEIEAWLASHPEDAERLRAYAEQNALLRSLYNPVLDEPVPAALLAVPEGFGDDVPIDPDFHARRLPDAVWRRPPLTDGIACIVQVHRLREVLALLGFTRFDAVTPDIQGEYESDVERAELRAS